MSRLLWLVTFAVIPCGLSANLCSQTPIADAELIFAEQDGLLAVEAEHFFKQERTDTRAFYLTHAALNPTVQPDGDPPHVAGASGGAYLEILPDTRRTHADRLIEGTNFASAPGKMAILSYQVHITNPGKYYVWVRALSTGSEDNGLHVGIDGTWPSSGERLQWCQGKQNWWWESKQRTAQAHCGEPHKIFLQIDQPGNHVIHFSMREDGFEFDKWLMTLDRDFKRPVGTGPNPHVLAGTMPPSFQVVDNTAERFAAKEGGDTSPTQPVSDQPLIQPRQPDGDAAVTISGEIKQWHKVTLDLSGPYAHEQDNTPNPFTDMRMTVRFEHTDGTTYQVPGYFAADGDAANTSAESGTCWRAHFAPDRVGTWSYLVEFHTGQQVAVNSNKAGKTLIPYSGITGQIKVAPSDKSGRDFRAQGRLQYVGKRYLQFAGSKEYFFKAGADAPETLLAYADFDNTIGGKLKRAPIKTWAPHVKDWRPGDPTWKDSKGKGLVGAINYLAAKGCNAFSFLTYNAGGDGDNVWPFIHRNDKLHYDCSKLDQWGIIFDHGTSRGMHLHFKLQETENDDHRRKGVSRVPESLDGGNLGIQRKLYCRELIARFGHQLALNWNIGEENTQSTEQQTAMIDYIADIDTYHHPIVIHTYPRDQQKVYRALLGTKSKLTGASLQNGNIRDTHVQTLRWVNESNQAGKPWVVAFDESGSAEHGQCPDLGYRGFDGRDKTGKRIYTEHKVRRQTLWGNLMAGGAGVEYYFGYQFVEDDLACEDWRSRDRSWDYCRVAIDFLREHEIPIELTVPSNPLIGNSKNQNNKYCLAVPGSLYLVYLPTGGETTLDLSAAQGTFTWSRLNPRTGQFIAPVDKPTITGGQKTIVSADDNSGEDWLIVLRKQ